MHEASPSTGVNNQLLAGFLQCSQLGPLCFQKGLLFGLVLSQSLHLGLEGGDAALKSHFLLCTLPLLLHGLTGMGLGNAWRSEVGMRVRVRVAVRRVGGSEG